MKYKSKALAILLAGCMIFSAGCGAASDESEKAPGAEAQESENAPAGETQESTESAETQTESPISAPQVDIFSGQDMDWHSEDGEHWLLHGEYTEITVGGEGYEAVAESIHKWSEERIQELWTYGEELSGYVMEDPSFSAEESDYYRYYFSQDVELVRADSRIISLVETFQEYSGGAHGNYGYSGLNFDSRTGQMLVLSDILKDEEGFRQKAQEYIIDSLKEKYGDGLFEDYETTVKEMWDREDGPTWYLNAAGVTFVFSPYEVGPYAMGKAQVTLPYGEFAEYLSDAYTSMSEPGTAQIPFNVTVSSAGIPGADGQAGSLWIGMEIQEEYGYGPVYVEVNGSRAELGEFERMDKAFLLKREGRTFVIVDTDYASDDFVTFVYEITEGTPRECERLENVSLQGASVNTDRVELCVNLNVLGTYHTMMGYLMDEDGRLHQENEFFDIPSNDNGVYLLVTKRELPVRIEDGAVMLPVGSRIRITGTDNKGIALFRDEDTNAEGDICYTRGDGGEDIWTLYIDGVSEYEYFEMIPYAG